VFRALYDNPLHIPVAAWLACFVAVGIAFRRKKLVGFIVLFAVVCGLDAWLTGPWTPLRADSAAMTAAGITFVIAGDLRYFVLLTDAVKNWRRLPLALGLAFIVPVIVQIARAAGLSELRKVFLVYELLFFVLALVIWFVVRPASTFTRRLTLFEIAQYGLWAGADILLISTGADLAWLLRMVPNLMYYAFFLIVAARWAD
jgi:hypothetical protein